jgi:hypothetical protein
MLQTQRRSSSNAVEQVRGVGFLDQTLDQPMVAYLPVQHGDAPRRAKHDHGEESMEESKDG